MGEVATEHQLLARRGIFITEPATTANRGEIARWLEDHGRRVAVPHPEAGVALVVHDRYGHEIDVAYGERVAVDGPTIDTVDAAHYTLWYDRV